jgi:hypothetical protein
MHEFMVRGLATSWFPHTNGCEAWEAALKPMRVGTGNGCFPLAEIVQFRLKFTNPVELAIFRPKVRGTCLFPT